MTWHPIPCPWGLSRVGMSSSSMPTSCADDIGRGLPWRMRFRPIQSRRSTLNCMTRCTASNTVIASWAIPSEAPRSRCRRRLIVWLDLKNARYWLECVGCATKERNGTFHSSGRRAVTKVLNVQKYGGHCQNPGTAHGRAGVCGVQRESWRSVCGARFRSAHAGSGYIAGI